MENLLLKSEPVDAPSFTFSLEEKTIIVIDSRGHHCACVQPRKGVEIDSFAHGFSSFSTV